jgi:hypothetical protein
MNWFSDCFCVGGRGSGGGTHIGGVCPPECVTIRSVIYPAEQGVPCNSSIILELKDLVEKGNCSNISYSVYNAPNNVDAIINVDNQLIITNTGIDTVGYVEVLYKVNCVDDIRSAIGFIKFYVGPNDICV